MAWHGDGCSGRRGGPGGVGTHLISFLQRFLRSSLSASPPHPLDTRSGAITSGGGSFTPAEETSASTAARIGLFRHEARTNATEGEAIWEIWKKGRMKGIPFFIPFFGGFWKKGRMKGIPFLFSPHGNSAMYETMTFAARP